MVEFSDCYFCGSVEEAVEQHPVIPPSTDPPTDRQRRVVLCTGCQEKLERVTESIVAHLDPGAADRAGASAGVDGGTSMEFIGEVGGSAAGTPEDATDDTETLGEEVDSEKTDKAGGTESEATGDTETSGEQADTEETDGAGNTETGETEPGDTEPGETETGQTELGDTETGETEKGDEPVELPPETRNILQLLENRAFPVDREELGAVAANAYEVDTDDVELVFDTLIDQGRLHEDDGTLHKPD
jgi:hypothetical protein